jgi:hypothetical protein
MYSSRNPADRQAIIKMGWPGALAEQLNIGGEDGGPIEFVIKRGKDEEGNNTIPDAG